MIIGFVVSGIADLTQEAGKLLSITILISYISIGGFLSYTMTVSIFPQLIDLKSLTTVINNESLELDPFFTTPLTSIIDVTSVIIFAFIMRLSISWLKTNGKIEITYNLFAEFSQIIKKVLSTTIIPLLPFYIFCLFANMSYSGEVFSILSIFIYLFMYLYCVLSIFLHYLLLQVSLVRKILLYPIVFIKIKFQDM